MEKQTTPVKKVYNLIILDESGSMMEIKKATLSSFNEIIQTINKAAKDPELEQWLAFYTFNSGGIREQIALSPARDLARLVEDNYNPNECTPLYDAIGHVCNKIRFVIEKDQYYTVLVTILTDGYENDSKEYNQQSVSNLIKKLKEGGWVFTYIGANQDVEKVGRSLNISNNLILNASDPGMESFTAKEVSARQSYYWKLKNGMGGNLNEGYFDEEEKKEK